MVRFRAIEGFRAILAWWVVVSHLLQHSGLTPKFIFDGLDFLYVGIIPVYLFMIISGFVLAHLILSQQEKYPAYIFRRFFRLLPVMLVAMSIAFVMFLCGIGRFWPDSDLGVRIIAQLTLLHGMIPDNYLSKASMAFSPPGWSISLEWQFYLVAPFLLTSILSKKWYWNSLSLFVVLIGLVAGSIPDHRKFELINLSLSFSKPSYIFSALHYFLVGIFTYLFVQKHQVSKSMFVMAILIIGITFFSAFYDGRPFRWLVFPLWLLFVSFFYYENSWLTNIFSNKYMRYLGEISYSTYLLHIFVVAIVTTQMRSVFDDRLTLFFVSSVIAIPVIFLLSVISYQFIEKPFVRWAKNVVRE